MNEYVTDTVALILRLEKRTMGPAAHQIFADVEHGHGRLLIPTMSFAEIMYLAERKRIVATLADVHGYMQQYPNCVEAALTFAIVTTAQKITDIPELHDRLIAATAVYFDAPLLTNDRAIGASVHVQTLW
jgi:predicted nucleic acid-binding protein